MFVQHSQYVSLQLSHLNELHEPCQRWQVTESGTSCMFQSLNADSNNINFVYIITIFKKLLFCYLSYVLLHILEETSKWEMWSFEFSSLQQVPLVRFDDLGGLLSINNFIIDLGISERKPILFTLPCLKIC